MILTLSTTHRPATDLGYLLHKNPSRVHTAELNFGEATLLYPEANDERCTAAVMVEIDPIRLVRGRTGPAGEGGELARYVNDRPYCANSFLAIALRELLGTAMNGRSKDRPELAGQAIPLEIEIPALRAGDPEIVRGLFEPLGYNVEATAIPLDETHPEWGDSRYVHLKLTGLLRLADALNHLYVLIPALDGTKHYAPDEAEVEKLLRKGEGWLATHPLREAIVRRYLRRRRLQNLAMEQLAAHDDLAPAEETPEDGQTVEMVEETEEEQIKTKPLHTQRLEAAKTAILASGARSVVDLGCGEGRLIRMLLKETSLERILGIDVSWIAIERAHRNLALDRQPPLLAKRITLAQGSLVYRDARLREFDAAAVVEVIEHLDPHRLAAFERVLFEFAHPATVILTTPNREWNAVFVEEGEEGRMRHTDHRFEWSRAEFSAWCETVAERFGYAFTIEGVGGEHEEYGPPSQMAVFSARGEA